MPSPDVIVVGGGHNGIVCATYLARGGRKVLLLEASTRLGGTAATDEFAPGFRAPAAFASIGRLSTRVSKELDLQRHGLRTLTGSGPTVMLRDGEPLKIAAGDPAASFDSVGGPEGAAYRELERILRRTASALEGVLTARLPQIDPRGMGDLIDLLGMGWKLRRLGRRDMPEAMRLLPMALRDIARERFDDPTLQAAVAFPGLAHSWLGPFSAGGGLATLLHRPAGHRSLFDAPRFAAGGPGGLAAALVGAAEAAGVELRTNAPVARVLAGADRVRGVLVGKAEEIPASCVVSGIGPRRTLTRLLEPGWLDASSLDAARNIRSRGTTSYVRFALGGLPDFGLAAQELGGRLRIGATLEALEQAFDNAKYERLPDEPMVELTLPSIAEAEMAPAGKHVLHARVQYTPHTLRESDWSTEGSRLGTIVSAAIEAHAPGFGGLVEAVDVVTPADIERRWGLEGGHLYHAELALDQSTYMRPMPGWYDYATPLRGLYLTGPGCHPGGGLTGIPGRNAAARVNEDWKRGLLS